MPTSRPTTVSAAPRATRRATCVMATTAVSSFFPPARDSRPRSRPSAHPALFGSEHRPRQLRLRVRQVRHVLVAVFLLAEKGRNAHAFSLARRWNSITQVAILNSDPGSSGPANGVLTVYVGEERAMYLEDVVFRTNASVLLNAFIFSSASLPPRSSSHASAHQLTRSLLPPAPVPLRALLEHPLLLDEPARPSQPSSAAAPPTMRHRPTARPTTATCSSSTATMRVACRARR